MSVTRLTGTFIRSGSIPTWALGGGVVTSSQQFKTLTDPFTGSFFGTSSWANNAASASYATTASYAANAGSGLSGGTANYIPLWTSATAQSSSNIYQSSNKIGIGTINPVNTLQVQGNISASSVTASGNILVANTITVGTGKGTDTTNTAVGAYTLVNNTAYYNTAVGNNALYSHTNGGFNTAVGNFSQVNTTTGYSNASIGESSMYGDVAGIVGNNNSSIGASSLYNIKSGSNNTALGFAALSALTNGNYNVAIGVAAGSPSNGFGVSGVDVTTGNNNIFIGYLASGSSPSSSNEIIIGNSGSNYLRIPGLNFTISASRVGVGTVRPSASLHVVGTTMIQQTVEKITITGSAPPATYNLDLTSGSIFFNSASASANWTLNFRGDASTKLNDMVYPGQSITATVLVFTGATAYSASAYQIEGATVTPRWQGGTAATGNANSLDAHQFTIVKVASASYQVLGSITKYA